MLLFFTCIFRETNISFLAIKSALSEQIYIKYIKSGVKCQYILLVTVKTQMLHKLMIDSDFCKEKQKQQILADLLLHY